ncbi:Na+/H+ antiporter NhaA [Patulibacter sp.]|uniref:Na+/H+ antiporter NhaA n=1 Tax=Patulibacter sp. TaxID=1912859 RepID=UPI002715E2AE|nr:Na+/H+ antiporter NhaA [Patulibacter sp.]MDO9410808.1 Na+/H+ antiporter NhaA [Patulibacter sp.]
MRLDPRPSADPTPPERTAWARNLAAPVRGFLQAETGGAVVLVLAAVVALIWANSPWPDSYEDVWRTDLSVSLGDHVLHADLREWVNQGLMALFFLVVGLEAKRELDQGELRERTRLTIPVMAALGGMACTVGIYLAFNAGGEGADGWGAAMSTDTALALGALAIVTPAAAVRVRVFLLTMVVVDDLVALAVIGVFYSEDVSLVALGIAVLLFAVLIALRYVPRGRTPLVIGVGVGMWLAMFQSGVDPVISGLAIGLVTTSYPPNRDDLERATELTRSFREQPTVELATAAQRKIAGAISPNERLQHSLHPWTTYVIVPLFALANAGIVISGDVLSAAATSSITLGIFLGYVLGKPIGIVGASFLASRKALGGNRPAVTWPILTGAGAAAGVGFTLSLLIATLAFSDGELLDQAKIGILASAIVSPFTAWAAFAVTRRLPDTMRARQLGNVAETMIDLADDVDPERDHVRGDPDAIVTVVEYADFECPFCGRAEPTIRELMQNAGADHLRYVFRHLPLADVHPRAQLAAEASEAAAAQGMFWEMHDRLYEHQEELTPKELVGHAAALGLDVDRFTTDLRERRYLKRIERDVDSADESGVSGTPSFFINGRRHHGVYDIDALRAAVRSAKMRAGAARLAAKD